MFYRFNRAGVIAAWLVVAILGVLAGAWGYRDARNARRVDIERAAKGSALVMRIPQLTSLTGTHADEGTDIYIRIKNRLNELKRVHGLIHDAYVFKYSVENDSFVCLADGMPEGSPDLTRPGDTFEGIIEESDARRALSTNTVAINESQTDIFGRWVTAYAGIDMRVDVAGSAKYLLRLDMDMRGWRISLLEEAFSRALIAALLFGVPLAVYLLGRRDSEKTRFISILSTAIEQSPTALLILDDRGIIRYVNNGLCALSKYTREEMIGRHYVMTTADLPDDAMSDFTEAIKSGRVMSAVMTCEGKGGHKYDAFITTAPVMNEKGKVLATSCMIVDVSELERQARELRLAKEKAEASDKAKSVFLATMSHEVRTPLNSISGFSDLLSDTEMTEEQREYVQAIHSSSLLLSRLAENILDFTRIEQGVMHIGNMPVDVRALVRDVLDGMAERAEAKQLRVEGKVSADVPWRVLGDYTRLRQVLVNLVDNAIKFTPAGEIVVSVSLRLPTRPPFNGIASDASDAVQLEFSVSDTGIGIAPEDQARLFMPFVQLDSSSTRHYEGAGLGLAIAHDLVRLMGASGIAVKSEKGKGAIFSFVIACSKTE